MQLSHEFVGAVAVFDDENLVSCAGLVPVLDLAEQAGLSGLVASKVTLRTTRVRSAGANPAGKVTAIVAGMAAGADCIDDLEVIRSGGMSQLFAGVYAATTLGQFLREFTFGHSRQLASVSRAHLVALIGRTGCLPGIAERCFVDIDSLLRPVYGHGQAGRQLRAHQDRLEAGATAGPVPVGDHDQHRRRGPDDRRDPAARR